MPQVFADKTALDMANGQIWFKHVHEGNYYQIDSSLDLVSWTSYSDVFVAATPPAVFTYNQSSAPHKFFRAKGIPSAQNFSYYTLCAEYDNARIVFRGDVNSFAVKATHPNYFVTDYSSGPYWTDCNSTHVYTNYAYPARDIKIHEGYMTEDSVIVHNDAGFWRPQGMNVTIDGAVFSSGINVQQMVLHRYIPGTANPPVTWGEYPSFFVIYCDGNMRLIPFPPVGVDHVSVGTSVVMGPTDWALSTDEQEARPLSEISAIDYHTALRTLEISYRSGGSAVLDVNNVTRTQSVVNVTVNYSTDKPFCTVNSNFTSNTRCDTSTMVWQDLSGVIHTDPIMTFSGAVGSQWLFTKPIASSTRPSAPDISIIFP